MHIKPMKIKMCMYTVGAQNMITYGRVKPPTAGPVADWKRYVYIILS